MLDGYDCDYCIRNKEHGGICRESEQKRCLIFQEDPRGKIEFGRNAKIFFPMAQELPELNIWLTDYAVVNRISTNIKFTNITPIAWVRQKVLGLTARVSFYYFKPKTQKEPAEIIVLSARRK